MKNKKNHSLKKPTNESNSATNVAGTGKLLGYKVIKENGKEVKVPVYEGDPNRDIQPDRLQCNYYIVDDYELDHYESKSGKWLGIGSYRIYGNL